MIQNAPDPNREEVLRIAQSALTDSATYVDHISNLMANCVDQLRQGQDRDAMTWFARGAADLDQFIKLMDQLVVAARVPGASETSTFRSELTSCVREMEQVMIMQDFVELADRIEGQLLELLQHWPRVAEELQAGISAQA